MYTASKLYKKSLNCEYFDQKMQPSLKINFNRSKCLKIFDWKKVCLNSWNICLHTCFVSEHQIAAIDCYSLFIFFSFLSLCASLTRCHQVPFDKITMTLAIWIGKSLWCCSSMFKAFVYHRTQTQARLLWLCDRHITWASTSIFDCSRTNEMQNIEKKCVSFYKRIEYCICQLLRC